MSWGDPLPRRHPPGRGYRVPLPGLPGPTTGAVHRWSPQGALRLAVPSVRVPCPPLEDGGPGRYARWGSQPDVHNITRGDDEAGELSAEQVVGYLAKYATAMMPMVAAVGSDPVRHRRDAWLWTCRPATAATVLVRRAVVARV
jgi:hypothetical protein